MTYREVGALDVRPGDVWRCGTHVAYVLSVGSPAWDHVFKVWDAGATLLFLEGHHAGEPPSMVWMPEGLWTLLVRP